MPISWWTSAGPEGGVHLQIFRATNGKAEVWGKSPSYITAKYSTGDSAEKTSLLLTDGMPAASAVLQLLCSNDTQI